MAELREESLLPDIDAVNSNGVITPYSAWPYWLQLIIVGPNAVLSGFLLWAWWPKSNREWRKFGFVFAYTLIFWSVMVFVFHFR